MSAEAAALARMVTRAGRTLPKLADPGAPLLEVSDLRVRFALAKGGLTAVDGSTFRLDDG